MNLRPPRSTLSSSSAASDVYKRQVSTQSTGKKIAKMGSDQELAHEEWEAAGFNKDEATEKEFVEAMDGVGLGPTEAADLFKAMNENKGDKLTKQQFVERFAEPKCYKAVVLADSVEVVEGASTLVMTRPGQAEPKKAAPAADKSSCCTIL
eukprot:TRINITY_DN14746_c0_g1_i1.p1 TRINITY_DN14746_c0_g1~~TRINITY_DN14746_c0_g1_i1.p1  ORF type:complete len:151 (+),score=43.83 TRINITY_DN14746_c0_g1_i1:73-525(+)